MDVAALGCIGLHLQPLLNFVVGLHGDQRLVMAGAQRDIPWLVFDMPCVEHPLQHVAQTGQVKHPVHVGREMPMASHEVAHLGQGTEPPAGKSLQCLPHDRGHGFIRHQQFAMPRTVLELVAHGLVEHPIAFLHPRPHPVLHLLGVLLAAMGSDARQQVLNEAAVGILPEFDAGRFQFAPRMADGRAQLDVRFEVARKAADIVDDDDVRLMPCMAFQVTEHFFDLRSVEQAA